MKRRGLQFLALLVCIGLVAPIRESGAEYVLPTGQMPRIGNSPELRRLPPVVSLCSLPNPVETAAVRDAARIPVDVQPASSVGLPVSTYPASTASDSPFLLTPYGFFALNTIYSTRRTETGAFTAFVLSPQTQGEGAFIVDARQSLVGIEVSGPPIAALGNAESRGCVELDFFGNFITENRTSLLLRHAYVEFSNDAFRIVAGQAWDVISPLNPGTIDYAAGLFAGNIGYRRAQLQFERFVHLSDAAQLSIATSINQDIVTDFATEPGVVREPSNWPVLEGRAAVAWGTLVALEQAEVGISGHIGETGFDFLTAGPPPLNLPPEDDARFLTWSANIDFSLPLTQRVRLRSELFLGANMSPFFGGIGQGVCPCERRAIRTGGGWLDISIDWTDQVRSFLGGGIEDPANSDILVGRTLNRFLFANIVWQISPELSTAFEIGHWQTAHHDQRGDALPPDQLGPNETGNAFVLHGQVKYEF